MKYYAYIPDENGNEPVGTFNRLMFELKTIRGARKRCYNAFGNKKYK